MAYYLVRARPHRDRLDDLWARLDSGEIVALQPFGRSLDLGLRQAKMESDEVAIWEEEDYCRPPLAQERAAVLDDYFDDITVETIQHGEGWKRIANLPEMW